MASEDQQQRLFWGCFLALITTAFGFISRMFLIGEWASEFGLNETQSGELSGMGVWPFAISIIGFSLFIDRIGYKTAMVISTLGYLVWSVMGVAAFFVSGDGQKDPQTGYQLLYWGSLILGLSNGAVEAYINPVVATLFKHNKTKWLNMLHAGWPGGLVIAGLITIALDEAKVDWWIRIAIIAVPAVISFLMLMPLTFPQQERVASGVSYREMLAELGVMGAAIAVLMIVMQLTQTFQGVNPWVFYGFGIAAVVAFGAYTRSLGNPLLFFLALIMIPLATTELGTDGWIEAIMKGVVTFNPGLVLVYTSLIMMMLRFFAGPLVHKLSPVGLLMACSALAIAGLYWLSFAQGTLLIFAAATVYAVGKSFFWPTMLGIAGEQTPKGGALTLNALGGIGMLAVGVLGMPYIGMLQAAHGIEAVRENEQIVAAVPGLVEDGRLTVTEEKPFFGITSYEAIAPAKLDAALAGVPEESRAEVAEEIQQVRDRSNQGALADMTIFPTIMLVCYIALALYFKSRGGYKAEVLADHYTGGVEGPAGR